MRRLPPVGTIAKVPDGREVRAFIVFAESCFLD